MRLPETALPVRIERIALVAPVAALRAALVRVADAGTVQLDLPSDGDGDNDPARRLRRLRSAPRVRTAPALSAAPPDLDVLERIGRVDLLGGEAQVQLAAAGATRRDGVAALTGWCPAEHRAALADALAPVGAAVVALPRPRGAEPPTLLRAGGPVRGSFGVLVSTYGTVPYADLDPTVPAGIAYAVMFGMMFGDAGHGLLLVLAAAVLAAARLRRPAWLARVAPVAWLARVARPAWLTRLARMWPFLGAAGLASVLFGALYGEFFGPTGVLPVLWLAPLAAPVRLLTVGVVGGAGLLAVAYLAGSTNRWREGGPRLALYDASGVAGAGLFAGLAAVVGGAYLRVGGLAAGGGAVALAGLALAAAGFFAGSGGGAAGAVQAAVEVFDTVVRLGSNVVSFARLAAFGLTHAALGLLVWRATAALAGRGPLGVVLAAAAFAVGTALTVALEALIAAVQALRLEYYELFSRAYPRLGRPFRPWHVPVRAPDAAPRSVEAR